MSPRAGTVVGLLLSAAASCAAAGSDPARFGAWTGRQHSFTGASAENGWVAGVDVDAPVAIGARDRCRLLVSLAWNALPDQEASLGRPETWGRTVELRAGLGFEVGRVAQHRTLVIARGGFASTVAGVALERYARELGAGLRLEGLADGTWIEITAGFHDRAGPRRGQLMVAGQLRLGRGPLGVGVALRGDAALNLRRAGRDVSRLAVVLDR